jgi:YbbR domain-containing protein
VRLSERARLFLLSLLIAIGAWWYVGTFAQPSSPQMATASLNLNNVEVTFSGVPNGWRATSTPPAVDIELRWPASGLLSVRPGDVRAIAEVSSLGTGTHEVSLRIQVPPGVTTVQASPPTVAVTLRTP